MNCSFGSKSFTDSFSCFKELFLCSSYWGRRTQSSCKSSRLRHRVVHPICWGVCWWFSWRIMNSYLSRLPCTGRTSSTSMTGGFMFISSPVAIGRWRRWGRWFGVSTILRTSAPDIWPWSRRTLASLCFSAGSLLNSFEPSRYCCRSLKCPTSPLWSGPLWFLCLSCPTFESRPRTPAAA